MANVKQKKRGAIKKGNGLSSPVRKLYETVVVKDPVRQGFYQEIAEILRTARAKAYRASNFLMVEAYWTVGQKIVEEEQFGKRRADYGKRLIEGLSQSLTEEFGKGYNISNLWCMRQFYTCYPILRAVRGECVTNTESEGCGDSAILRSELSWTHYRLLLRVEKPEARTWYMNEAAEQNWSTRALERQIGTLYYERLLMSRGKRKPVEGIRMKIPGYPSNREADERT